MSSLEGQERPLPVFTRIFENLQHFFKNSAHCTPCCSFVYLEEDFEDARVGVCEQDDGEECTDAAIEHRGPDVGHGVLGPLVAAPCKGGTNCRGFFREELMGGLCVFGRGKQKIGPN